MTLEKKSLRYTGKAKTLYDTEDAHCLIMEFRDDTSAFDGIKTAKLAHKGMVNNYFNAFIMQKLEASGIATQFIRLLSPHETLVKHLHMIPVECVVRNIAAGHLCSRLGVEEGITLTPPTFEFFLKNDALHDPMINESLIRTFNWASEEEVALMKSVTMQVNNILKPLFLQAGLLLVDFKLEFGRYEGKLLLGDEFTPDGCRIWDVKTRNKLDKDRFRKDLGGVIEAYEEVARRLAVPLPTSLHAEE
ncbi:MAG TPA: phosphoribosylaminoimidazolesuccinocarboxamide synthase [Gammaproteobacteria bacterium]|nr:phosphoribosylaminoimidazolesuccinocarboxamide synthase [Gammaproteobacteria bacterium]